MTTMTAHYGPQHPHVAKIIRRAGQLTPGERQALADVWTARAAENTRAAWAALDAARAARDAWAARAAVRAAWAARDGRYAARASWDAWAAARVIWYAWTARDAWAARDAGLALATWHLVGYHDYAMSHYRDLVGPWELVIGKVHPDEPTL